MNRKIVNKKKFHWYCISITALTLLFFNMTTYAATFADFFSIPKDDYSLVLLKMIFGPMNGVLKTGSTDLTIMGTIFKTFNSAMLCLAVIVIMYTVVMSILNTAHQGEFLGKKYDSMWVPLRSILGVIVIIPTHSGYSIIQIIMMWVVIQGIGAADHVWNAAYNFNPGGGNQTGNNLLGSPLVANPDMTTFTNFGNTVKKATVCLNAAYKEYGGATSVSDTPITLGDPFTNVVFSSEQNSSNGNGDSQPSTESYDGYNFNCYFPAYIPDSEKNQALLPDCTTFPLAATQSKYGQPPYYDPQNQDPSKQGAAPIQVNCGILKWPSPGNTSAETQYKMTSELEGIYEKNIKNMFSTLNSYAQAFVFQGTAFPVGDKDPTPALAAQFQQQISQYEGTEGAKLTQDSAWAKLPEKGWIFAGSYYYSIANLSNIVGSIGTLANLYSDSGSGDSSEFAGQTINTSGPTAGQTAWNWGAYGSLIPLNEIIYTFEQALVGTTTTSGFINKNFNYKEGQIVNPIVVIQLLGARIVDIIEAAFEMGIIAILTFAVLAGICPAANPTTMIFSTISRFILIPIMFGLGLLLTIGLTMEVYIPMVPFIIFFFASMGWLIGVIETVLAAPLVALGIAHPEGQHELYGRAEPALMLLVNVFIRPSFLIIGLIVAILLAAAAVTLLNLTFSIIQGATTSGLGASYGAVQSVLYLCIYVSLVITIINKSFGLITTLTDAVLRFIGNQHQLGAEQGSGEQEMKQAFSGAAGAGSQVEGATTGQASAQSEKGIGAWEHGGGAKGYQDSKKKTPEGTAEKAKGGGDKPGGGETGDGGGEAGGGGAGGGGAGGGAGGNIEGGGKKPLPLPAPKEK